MRYGFIAVFGVTVGLWYSFSGHTAAQGAQAANTSAATKSAVPKTPWGHPDLGGVWTTDLEIGVPLERPKELGTKALLSEAEYKQRTEMLKRRYNDAKDDRGGEVGNGQGPVHWYEGATQALRMISADDVRRRNQDVYASSYKEVYSNQKLALDALAGVSTN